MQNPQFQELLVASHPPLSGFKPFPRRCAREAELPWDVRGVSCMCGWWWGGGNGVPRSRVSGTPRGRYEPRGPLLPYKDLCGAS